MNQILSLSWKDYYEKIISYDENPNGDEEYPNEDIQTRIKLLDLSQNHFATYKTFSAIKYDDKRMIAGLGRRNVGAFNWFWFGRMESAGRFKGFIAENHPRLSAALDAIPLKGKVTKEHFLNYINICMTAFPLGFGIGCATRLLVMKRPDYFVAFNSESRETFKAQFGVPTSLKINDSSRYWDMIIQPIIDCDWWNSPMPTTSEQEQKVWLYRSAMIDVLAYSPDY